MSSTFDLGGAEGPPPPPMTIFGLATAHYAARCVQMAAIHGFADHIADTPRSAAAIAAAMRLDADALDRVLRLLAMHGVFRREAAGYAHTPASELLRSDHPMSLRAFAAMMGDGSNWKSLEVFSHALATGRPAAEKIHPKGIWGWYADHGDEARQFDAAMTSKSQGDIALLIAALDLRGVATVADIGGGRGHFLAAILDANPGVTGVLFDQPEVVANAGDHPRMKKVGGDFFRGALPAADLYLMTHIIHDWADADAIRILTNLRAAAPRGARLVLYELSLPEGAEPHPAKTLDIVMLTITGGRERTPGEYARLFSAAGWTDEGVVRTLGPMALHSARA